MAKNVGATVFESTMASGEQVADANAHALDGELHRGAGVSRYMLLERVGAGGMGVVWAAYDPELDRKVAIKLLRPRRGSEGRSQEARARLLREAQAMARLSHPHVIPVHDVGEHGGQVFVAMEFVEGHTLGAWVRGQAQPREPRAIVEMFIQAGRGLVAAHAAGLVHRDFKPDNVLVGDDGRARVTDFGLARSLETETLDEGEMAATAEVGETGETGEGAGSPAAGRHADSSGGSLRTVLTRTGIMLGTPAYMAPEQFTLGNFDARSDQFSFCVALWEALYGQRPFAGRTVLELSDAVTSGQLREPPPDSRVPSFVNAALRRGLAVDPAARWGDLASLLTELERDPSLGRRRLTVGVGLAASLIGALVVMPALAERHHAATAEVCPVAEARLEGVWDAKLRHAVLDSVGAGHDLELGTHVVAGLDRYATQWLAMHVDACEDTNVRHELSPAILDKRMQCLDERRMALAAATELLASVDPQQQRDPMNLLGKLPSIERCGDLSYLESQLPMPDDRELAAKVEDVRHELAKLRAQVDLGDGRSAIEPLEQLLVRAEALDYPPLHAQVLTELGFADAGAGEPTRVRGRLEQAIVASIRTGQDELAARAGTELIYVVGWALEDVPTALYWAEVVEAWHDRTHALPVARALALIAEGVVRTKGGMDGEGPVLEGLALLGVDASLVGVDQLEPAEATAAGWGINFLGISALYRGDFAHARECFRAGHQLRARLVGPDHTSLGAFEFNWSQAAFYLGDWGEAARLSAGLLARREELERSSQDLSRLLWPWSVEQAIARAVLLGEPACADKVRAAIPEFAEFGQRLETRVVLARAQRVCGDLDGADATLSVLAPEQRFFSPDNIVLWQERGHLHLAQAKLDEAQTDYQAALDWALKLGQREQVPVADALAGLAAVALARGQDDEAAAKLREALAIDDAVREQGDGHPASVARLEALAALDPAQADALRARAETIRERVRGELGG